MSAYSRGAQFERRTRKFLEAQGWTVFRSAGSKSPADLICLRMGEVLLVQCQLDSYFPPAKREQFEFMVRENGVQGAYVWREGKKIQFKGVGE